LRFVVFCGDLRVLCGVLRVFCECFAVFPQNTRKTSKNTGNTKNSQYARVLRAFSKRAKIFDCIAYCTKHLSQNICKTPQNKTVIFKKHSQNSHKTCFVKLRRKTPQNKRETLKKGTKRSQYSRNMYLYCTHSVYSSQIR